MKEKLTYLSALVLIIIFINFLQYNKLESLESFSLQFNDINFHIQDKEPNKNIVFLAIDEASVYELGRWPWGRDIIAQGIDKLSLANIVIFDMIFSEKTSQENDILLADSIANLNTSVCGFFLRDKSVQKEDEDLLDTLDDSALDFLQSQIDEYSNPDFIAGLFAQLSILPITESCTLSGSFSTLFSSDELIRSYPLAVYQDMIGREALYPSLGTQALRIYFNSDISRVDENTLVLNEQKIQIDALGFTRLNYYKKSAYNIVYFHDLMNNPSFGPDYFKDKIVIFGVTEVGSGDVVSTPIGQLPGPLVHYTFISNFLENHLITEYPYLSLVLCIFMIFLPFILILFMKKVLYRVLTNLLVYSLIYILVRSLFVYEMLYIDLFYPLIAILLSAVVMESIAFNFQERSSKFIKDAFSSYLSSTLLNQLVQNPKSLTLGGEKKNLSILFSDIRGFTSTSESMDAESLVHLLNRYFTPMTEAVLKHEGMLDKYIGDAVMAFFNAPVDVEEHAKKACLSALMMIEKLDVLNQELAQENIPPIKIGIGINTADVVVGNMGADNRFNYTVMGDGVNLASRVESLTKNYGVEIIITEFTVAQLDNNFIYREIEKVKVKGKNRAVLIYELMPSSKASQKLKEHYEVALAFYKNGDKEEAKKHFKELVHIYNDNLSKYFLSSL